MRHIDLKLLAILAIFISCFPASSFADVISPKDTVTGTVIGKNKEPLPGAKVEIIGQPYSVFTDLDGRFNIKCEPGAKKVRVSYPKARDVKKKISPDMTVRIGRTWRQVPENYQTFFGANIGVGLSEYYGDYMPQDYFDPYNYEYYDEYFVAPTLSVMVGRVKAVGWYFKGFYSFPTEGDQHYQKAQSAGAILGGMVRLGCPLHLYLGGGFGYTKLSKFDTDIYHPYSWQIDLGLLFRIKDHCGINLSMNLGEAAGELAHGSFMNLGFVYFLNK